MRQSQVFALILLGLATAGCQTEDSPVGPFRGPTVPVLETDAGRAKEERPLPDNIYDPSKPTWVPYFEVPVGWEVSPSDRGALRGSGLGRDDWPFISLSLYLPPETPPREARDTQAAQADCQSAQRMPWTSWLNCSRPAETGELEVAGQTVYFLRYWGHWMDENRRMEEYFFRHQDRTRMITLDGGTDADREVVKTIIATLEFRYEIFEPEPEYGEVGGL